MGVCNTLSPPPSLLRKANRPSLVKPRLQLLLNAAVETPPSSAAVNRRQGRNVRIGEVRIIPVDRHLADARDEHERARMWWTKDERRETADRNHLLTEDFRVRHPSHVLRATALFDQICAGEDETADGGGGLSPCSDSSSSSSDDDDEEGGDSRMQQQSLEEDLVGELTRKAMIDLPAHLRGLEGGILPSSKAHRRTHVRRVLQWQQTLSRPPPHGGGDDQDDAGRTALLLGRHAAASSRRSRLLARILAESDAAATCWHGTDLQDSRGPELRRNRPRMIPSWW